MDNTRPSDNSDNTARQPQQTRHSEYEWEKEGANIELYPAGLSWKRISGNLIFGSAQMKASKAAIDGFNIALQECRENKSAFNYFLEQDRDLVKNMENIFKKKIQQLFENTEKNKIRHFYVGLRRDELGDMSRYLNDWRRAGELFRQNDTYLLRLLEVDYQNNKKQHKFLSESFKQVYESFENFLGDPPERDKSMEMINKLEETIKIFEEMQAKSKNELYRVIDNEIEAFRSWFIRQDKKRIEGNSDDQWKELNEQYRITSETASQAHEVLTPELAQALKAYDTEASQLEKMCVEWLEPDLRSYQLFEESYQTVDADCQEIITNIDKIEMIDETERNIAKETIKGLHEAFRLCKARLIRDGDAKAKALLRWIQNWKQAVEATITNEQCLDQFNHQFNHTKNIIGKIMNYLEYFDQNVHTLFNNYYGYIKQYITNMDCNLEIWNTTMINVNEASDQISNWDDMISNVADRLKEFEQACHQPIALMAKDAFSLDKASSSAPRKKLSELFSSLYEAISKEQKYAAEIGLECTIHDGDELEKRIKETKALIEPIDRTYDDLNYHTKAIIRLDKEIGGKIRDNNIKIYKKLLTRVEESMQGYGTQRVSEVVGEIQRHAVMVQEYLDDYLLKLTSE